MAAKKKVKRAAPVRTPKVPEYVLWKGGPLLLEARTKSSEIRFRVNGPGMLFASVRLVTTLDALDGATAGALSKLARELRCVSKCGLNGVTRIPVEVKESRIGAHLEFSLGPMSMYQSLVILSVKTGRSMKEAIDEAFGAKKRFSALFEPVAAEGHAEHDHSTFGQEPDEDAHSAHAGHGH